MDQPQKFEQTQRAVDGPGGEALDLGDVIDAEWGEDLLRRVREIEEGKVQLVSEEDFLSKLRAV
jgi:hypothetical protein